MAGTTKATMGSNNASVDWKGRPRQGHRRQRRPHQTTWFGAPASPGNLKNNNMFLPWGKGWEGSAGRHHQAPASPGSRLQSVAAIVELKAPFAAGYSIKKTVTPVEQANKSLPAGQYTHRGDVLRDAGGERHSRHDLGGHHRPILGGATIWARAATRSLHRGEKKSGGWSTAV